MTRFYQPDLSEDIDSPFARDGADKLVRRSYWLDMNDRTLVMVMVNGIGKNLTNDEKRAHLVSIGAGSGPQIGIQKGPPRFALRTISVRPVGAGRGCGDGASAG